MDKCCLCNKAIEGDNAALLSMTAAGRPRYLCDECADLLDKATLSHEYEEIGDAMDKVSQHMSKSEPDGVTYSLISKIMVDAAVRAKLIKEGAYDFSRDDEPKSDEIDEIPEDMLESEEDIKKDEEEEIKLKRFNKVYNIILYSALAVTAGIIIYRIIQNFLLNKG